MHLMEFYFIEYVYYDTWLISRTLTLEPAQGSIVSKDHADNFKHVTIRSGDAQLP